MIVRAARHADRRRGVASLIEVLAAITLTATLLGMTAMMTTLLFRLEGVGRDELAATIAEGRLAEDVRDDVRAAVRIEPGTDGAADRLDLLGPDGGTVSYRFEDGAVVRLARDGEGVDRRESYRLPAGASARWERAEDDRGIALVLDWPRLPGTAGDGRRVVRVEATLGRDHRFEGDGP